MDLDAYVLSKSYTDETVVGGGAIKGKNCTVDSITPITGGQRVTFKWTLDDGTVKTGTMDVMNGQQGEPGEPGASGDPGLGIKDVSIVDNHLIITYDDDTTEDAGEISGGGGGDTSLTSAVTSNLNVGAIPSGTTLPKGTTFTQFVQKLLITEIAPTASFSISKSGNVEYGTSYPETLTLTVSSLGSAKRIVSIEWYRGIELFETTLVDSRVPGTWTYNMPNTSATTTYKAVVNYEVSDGSAVKKLQYTASINFYYGKFYGAVSDLNPSEATVEALTKVLGTAKGGTYTFTTNNERICYAYPKSLGALSSIKDGNGFSLFDSFTRTEQNYTQNGTTVAYYRYVLTDAATVNNYSVTFA